MVALGRSASRHISPHGLSRTSERIWPPGLASLSAVLLRGDALSSESGPPSARGSTANAEGAEGAEGAEDPDTRIVGNLRGHPGARIPATGGLRSYPDCLPRTVDRAEVSNCC